MLRLQFRLNYREQIILSHKSDVDSAFMFGELIGLRNDKRGAPIEPFKL